MFKFIGLKPLTTSKKLSNCIKSIEGSNVNKMIEDCISTIEEGLIGEYSVPDKLHNKKLFDKTMYEEVIKGFPQFLNYIQVSL